MLVCFNRSGLMVNDETPTSYLPEEMPGMIEPNGVGTNVALSPSFAATARNRSTSKPIAVLPSLARNSFGAYVASVPTVMVPSEATALGTLAARAGSAFTAASLLEAAAPGEPDELEPEPLDPPQAASDRVSAVAPVSRMSERRA